MHQRYHTFDILPRYTDNIYFINELQDVISKYRLETSTLKQQLNDLETENKIKDRILDEKSKHIITVTSENLRLKHELQTLQKQLNIKRKSILLNKKRKRRKKSNKIIKNKNNLHSETSFDYLDSESMYSNENDTQMPYLIPRFGRSPSEISESSVTSNLSEAACRLAFPKAPPQDSNLAPVPYINTASTTLNMLSPIAENNCDDHHDILIKISDNNNNIEHDEWNDCMAAIPAHVQQPQPQPQTTNTKLLHVIEDDDESSSMCSYGSNDDTTDSFDDTVSYMTDNTALLMDMNFGSKNKLQYYDHSNSDHESQLPEKTIKNKNMQKNYDQISSDQLIGCDTVIQSPIVNLVKSKSGSNSLNLNSQNCAMVSIDVDNNNNNNNNNDHNNNTKFNFTEFK